MEVPGYLPAQVQRVVCLPSSGLPGDWRPLSPVLTLALLRRPWALHGLQQRKPYRSLWLPDRSSQEEVPVPVSQARSLDYGEAIAVGGDA